MSDQEFAKQPEAATSDAQADRFASFTELRSTHAEMMFVDGQSEATTLSADKIRTFLAKASATGSVIADPSNRREAQRALEYWSAALLARPGGRSAEAGPASLAPYRQESETSASDKGKSSLQYIRVAALARQWRDSDQQDRSGYLLAGTALEEAREFSDDPDVAAFVKASTDAEAEAQRSAAKQKKYTWASIGVAGLVLVSLALYSLNLQREAAEAQAEAAKADAEIALDQRLRAEEERDAAKLQADQNRRALEANEILTDSLRAAINSANERTAQLEKKQQILDTTLGVIIQELREGRINLSSLPSEVRTAALSRLAEQLRSGSLKLEQLTPELAAELKPRASEQPSDTLKASLRGYNQEFTGVEVPLPALSPELEARAYEKGDPILYLNYSLVLDEKRRLALFTAANLDREQRVVLPRWDVVFRPDLRIPKDSQADPKWFLGFDRGHLVSRLDIAWGKALPDDPGAAAAWLAQVTDVYPNIAPQSPNVNRRVWADLENWVRTEHNPAATKVSIFTGPVIDADDTAGVAPAAFWKIAVSQPPIQPVQYQQQEKIPDPQLPDSPGLVVDAFLVPNRPDVEATFTPDLYRISVAEIERLTGLKFAPVIEAVDPLASEGRRLAGEVEKLNDAPQIERDRVTQALKDAVRGNAVSEPDQRILVGALVEMAKDMPIGSLKPYGRRNLLRVLAAVPAKNWDRPDWLALKAGVRRAVGDLELALKNDTTSMGPETSEPYEALKVNIGFKTPHKQTVYFQFAGMTRARAATLSDKLKIIGWTIPGEERIDAATGVNEVRYNPDSADDRAAAALLAADLVAAGMPEVVAAKNNQIKPGIVEIWISISDRGMPTP